MVLARRRPSERQASRVRARPRRGACATPGNSAQIIKEMAAGLGMSVADVLDIEKGLAMDNRVTHYAAWLTRVEAWSAGKRERASQAANREGRRFDP